MSLAHSPRGAVVALIAAAASWGLGTVVSKRAVEEIPPLTLLAVQLAVSVAALALLMRWRGMPLRDPAAPAGLGRLGLLNPGLAYALSLFGLTQITASLSVLIWTIEPLLILLLAAIVLGERVGPMFLALSGVAVAGIVLILYEPGSTGALAGVALTVAGIACCAVYTVAGRRWLGTVDSTGPVVLAQQAWALALALAVVALVAVAGGAVAPSGVSALGWASAIASGVVYYGAAYWFYLSALRRMPASAAAASFYLIPVFGVAGGIVLLGERLEPVQWVGAAIVVLAVAVILQRSPSVGGVVAGAGPAADPREPLAVGRR